MEHTRNRKLKGFAAALAAGLLAVPAAQAGLRTDARHAVLLEKAGVAQVDARHQALLDRHTVRPGVSVTVKSGSGIDWADAGVGAAGALGLVVLAGSGVLVGRRKLAHA
jgi:hypothetical protein